MVKRLKQAWKRDRLGVLGVASALVAFVLWAFPVRTYYVQSGIKEVTGIDVPPWIIGPVIGPSGGEWYVYTNFFTSERLSAAAASLALAVILLLLRRR